MENEIQQIVAILGSASDAVLSEYVQWMVASSLTWMMLGVGCSLIAFALTVSDVYCRWDGPGIIAGAMLFICGTIMVGSNIPDYLQPKAAAIHQLLVDVKPR